MSCGVGYTLKSFNLDPNDNNNIVNNVNNMVNSAKDNINIVTGQPNTKNNYDKNDDKTNQQNKKINEEKLIKLKSLYKSLPKYEILDNFLNKFIENYNVYSDSQYQSNNRDYRDNYSDNNDYTDNKNYKKILDLLLYLKNYRNRSYVEYKNIILKYLLDKLYNNQNNTARIRGGGEQNQQLDQQQLDQQLRYQQQQIDLNNHALDQRYKIQKEQLEQKTEIQTQLNAQQILIQNVINNFSDDIKTNPIFKIFVENYKKKITNNFNKHYNNMYSRNSNIIDHDIDVSNDPEMILLNDIKELKFQTLDELIQFLLNKLIGVEKNSTTNNSIKNVSSFFKGWNGGKSKKYKKKRVNYKKNKKNITKKYKKKS